MAVDEDRTEERARYAQRLDSARRPGFGLGLLKGLGVTLKHLFKHNTVIEYPDEKQDLPSRTRGVIALKEENCTVCMLCGRECPDWCIYIDSHKETLAPKREGGRPRKRNVLDRFAIDYALCMYCGICVEVCPYDALFWSREFEYAEYDIRELTHEKEKLSDWMATVLPPPELEDGAELPGAAGDGAPAARQTTTPATGARPPTTTSSAAAARPAQAAAAPSEGTAAPTAARPKESQPGVSPERARGAAAEQVTDETTTPPEAAAPPEDAAPPEAGAPSEDAAPSQEGLVPQVEVPHEAPRPVALEKTEDPEQVYRDVLTEQRDRGSSPQVAEARAKVARVKAERGIKRGPTPVDVDKPVPSAPTKGAPAEPEPGGAPHAEEPRPEQGPVAPEPAAEAPDADARPEVAAPEPAAEAPRPSPAEDPEAAYERVLAEEKSRGSSPAVATARAKAARMRAIKANRDSSS